MVDVVYTDIERNTLPTLALTNRTGLGTVALFLGMLCDRGKITVDRCGGQYDSITYRNEIICSPSRAATSADSATGKCPATCSQSSSGFSGDNNIVPLE